jgi:hypothetical protein
MVLGDSLVRSSYEAMSGDISSRATTKLDTIALDQLDNSLGEGRPFVREKRCSLGVHLRGFVRAEGAHRAPEQRLARPSLCVFGVLGNLEARSFEARSLAACCYPCDTFIQL